MKRVAFLVAIVIALCPAVVRAEEPSAQALFEEGLRLLERGDYAAACARLAESQWRAPAGGTALDLGYCNEKRGRLASALAAYEDALARALAVGRADRTRVAQAKVDELTRRVSRLRVRLDPRVASLDELRVEIDGTLMRDPGEAVPVDAGEHVVRVQAAGKAPLSRRTDVDGEGATVELVIDALADAQAAPTEAAHAIAIPQLPLEPPTPSRKPLVIGLGTTGGALVATGAVAGVLAILNHNKSNDLCAADPMACQSGGAAAEDRARAYALVSTVSIGVGVAAAGVATYLWLTTPRTKSSASLTMPFVWRF